MTYPISIDEQLRSILSVEHEDGVYTIKLVDKTATAEQIHESLQAHRLEEWDGKLFDQSDETCYSLPTCMGIPVQVIPTLQENGELMASFDSDAFQCFSCGWHSIEDGRNCEECPMIGCDMCGSTWGTNPEDKDCDCVPERR